MLVLTRLLFSLALVDHDIAGAEDCKQLLLNWSCVDALAAYMLYVWLYRYIGVKYVAGFVFMGTHPLFFTSTQLTYSTLLVRFATLNVFFMRCNLSRQGI
jgi:hypothetical protein